MLLLFELNLSCGTDLDQCDTAGQLREALLELLTIPVGVSVLNLSLDLVNPAFDVVVGSATVNDGGVVLGDHDALGGAEQVESDVLKLEANFFADDLAAGEDCHVLQHRLAAVAEARGLDGSCVERAADLVHDECGQGLTVDVLGNDHERLAGLHDCFEGRQHCLDCRNLGALQQDVGVVEDDFLALSVGHEVRREVALIELHAFGEVELGAKCVRLLDSNNAILTDLVDRVSDDFADRRIGCRNGGDVGDVRLLIDVLGLRLKRIDRGQNRLFDALLDGHRVGACGDIPHPDADHCLCEHGGGSGAVASDVVSLGSDFLDELGAHVLKRIFELDLLRDGDTIVGDRGSAELLVEHYIAALRTNCHLDCVGQLVYAGFQRATRFVVKF